MENDNNLLINNNDLNEKNNEYQEEDQKEINNNNIYQEEEYEIEQMDENENNMEEMSDEGNNEMVENNEDTNSQNEEEQIIIENENGKEDLEENNIEEMLNEEKEENDNAHNNPNEEKEEEEELYNNEKEVKINDKYNLLLEKNSQNKNIKIEEYEPELNENKEENNEKQVEDEYILNTLAKIKRNSKLKMTVKNFLSEYSNQSSNTEDKIVQTEFEDMESINKSNEKIIYLTPIINSCKVAKRDNISLGKSIQENFKYGINEEGNPINISQTDKEDIIAYIIPKQNSEEKNYLIDTKGNLIPKTDEGNYIYIQNNKSILIKDYDVQNPEKRTNFNNNINNNDFTHLRKNIYNKSNDDIKRILNIDNNNNYNNTAGNLLNFNNLMDVWRQRYGKRGQLYQQIKTDLDNNFNKEKNDKMVKRTNSILKMTDNNYISSFTDGNDDNKYKTPKYYNGIINRKYSNPLLKKNNLVLNSNRYNPLLKPRNNNNKSFFIKKNNNFTDILRSRFNISSDDINNKNLSFEELNFKGKYESNKFLNDNKTNNNYNVNNILKNNLYKRILERNREKEISKSFELNNNNRSKKYSIIKNSIYNTIKDINNKRKEKSKYSVLSFKANQLIKNFNIQFKNKKT